MFSILNGTVDLPNWMALASALGNVAFLLYLAWRSSRRHS